MTCPRCGSELSLGHLEFPTIIVCDRCGGILKLIEATMCTIVDPRDLAQELETARKARTSRRQKPR